MSPPPRVELWGRLSLSCCSLCLLLLYLSSLSAQAPYILWVGPADGWRVLLSALATELEADGEPQIEVRGRNVRVVVTAPQHEVEMQGELFAAHESLIVSLDETPRPEAASEAEAEAPADAEAAAPDPPPAAPGLGGA